MYPDEHPDYWTDEYGAEVSFDGLLESEEAPIEPDAAVTSEDDPFEVAGYYPDESPEDPFDIGAAPAPDASPSEPVFETPFQLDSEQGRGDFSASAPALPESKWEPAEPEYTQVESNWDLSEFTPAQADSVDPVEFDYEFPSDGMDLQSDPEFVSPVTDEPQSIADYREEFHGEFPSDGQDFQDSPEFAGYDSEDEVPEIAVGRFSDPETAAAEVVSPQSEPGIPLGESESSGFPGGFQDEGNEVGVMGEQIVDGINSVKDAIIEVLGNVLDSVESLRDTVEELDDARFTR